MKAKEFTERDALIAWFENSMHHTQSHMFTTKKWTVYVWKDGYVHNPDTSKTYIGKKGELLMGRSVKDSGPYADCMRELYIKKGFEILQS